MLNIDVHHFITWQQNFHVIVHRFRVWNKIWLCFCTGITRHVYQPNDVISQWTKLSSSRLFYIFTFYATNTENNMGSCLSKSGKKGKTDEVDRAPYAPAAKSSPSHSDKQKDLGEVPLRTNVQLEKAPKVYHPGPVTVKGESDHQQPTKQEAVKLSAKQVQPSVSNLPFLSHCIKANFFGHMLMSQLGGSSQDDNSENSLITWQSAIPSHFRTSQSGWGGF